MQQYCLTGRMPPKSNFQCMEYDFPKNSLFSTQVKHTIEFSGLASMVFCVEEADSEIARAAASNSNAFVLGNDSDFCFFSNISYVPIYTLGLGVNKCLSGVVLRRHVLADSLDLPDEAAIVELAILMGNDYINPADAPLNDVEELFAANKRRRPPYSDLIHFLNQKGRGFRVTSISEDTEEVLSFIRVLYNLEDLSEFEYAKESNDSVDEESETEHNTQFAPSLIPEIPEGVNLELAEIRPLVDSSVSDAVSRCLQDFIDRIQASGNKKRNPVILQDHLEAFRKHNRNAPNHSMIGGSSREPFWRPVWDDVCVANIIEKVIVYSIKSNFRSLVVRLSPPFFLFNQFIYHRTLLNLRSRKNTESVPRKAIKIDTAPNQKEESTSAQLLQRVHLPIDEFENDILSSVRRNKVTIIQGETGMNI
jgi:hypothetical protein